MTVKELIDKLQQMPQDMQVASYLTEYQDADDSCGFCTELTVNDARKSRRLNQYGGQKEEPEEVVILDMY